MNFKFLQMNIYLGKWMEKVIEYVQKEDFDLICFQEVSGGRVSFNRDNIFQKMIDLGYDGELGVNWRIKGHYGSFEGNGTFFKKDFTLLEKTIVWLNDYGEIEDPDNRESRDDPKAALSVLIEKEGVKLRVVNAHLAWTPDAEDSPEKIRQAEIFRDYLKTIKKPYIIAGDFNVEKHTQVVKMIEDIGARNLTSENKVVNTLNSRLHKAPHLFPPGLAVDYILISDDIQAENFKVLDMDLSDHLGLRMDVDIKR